MKTFDAVMIAEGTWEASKDRIIKAFQYLIDNGLIWKLQGSFGRRATLLIDEGLCHKATIPVVQKKITPGQALYRSCAYFQSAASGTGWADMQNEGLVTITVTIQAIRDNLQAIRAYREKHNL